MKKLICMAMLVVVVLSLLTACGKFKCDTCGKEKTGKQHKEEVLGQEVVMCDDCYKEAQELSDGLKDLANSLGK